MDSLKAVIGCMKTTSKKTPENLHPLVYSLWVLVHNFSKISVPTPDCNLQNPKILNLCSIYIYLRFNDNNNTKIIKTT